MRLRSFLCLCFRILARFAFLPFIPSKTSFVFFAARPERQTGPVQWEVNCTTASDGRCGRLDAVADAGVLQAGVLKGLCRVAAPAVVEQPASLHQRGVVAGRQVELRPGCDITGSPRALQSITHIREILHTLQLADLAA